MSFQGGSFVSFFEDLTPQSYSLHKEEEGVLNIGWLGEGQPIPTGSTSAAFQDALKNLCDNRIGLHRGFHVCEYCPGKSRNNYDWGRIGNGQIRVCSQDGVWYAAPAMIYHYVDLHDYRPPQEFVEAVLNPKEIGTDELLKSKFRE